MRTGSRTVMGLVFGVLVLAGLLRAQAPAALTGKVSSPTDGAMEGVLVGAKKVGATISTWVVSNAQGQYSFPRDRMEPGKYAIMIRAAGYDLPKTSVEVTAQTTTQDLQLSKASVMKTAAQLTNAEWIMSAPGTEEQRAMLGGCVTCHTVERIMFSRHDADEMVQVIKRMSTHTNNSSAFHPWVRPTEPDDNDAPTERQIAMAKYFASINLSSRDTFDYPLKTLPRPKGKATQVIYTMYDLPRPDAAPHDVEFDAQGNAWYSDFNSQFIGKLDVKTGKTQEWPVPLHRTGNIAQGGLQIALDKDGRVYYGNMSQMQVVRFDPKTEKMETFRPPIPEGKFGVGHLTMVDPSFTHLDGKLWLNVAEGSDESGGTWQLDVNKNEWKNIKYPKGSPPARAYDVVANSKNQMYGMHMTNPRIWITDGKSLETTWFDFPSNGKGCRRGHRDSQDRLWCGDFNGNGLAMFDPATKKIIDWQMPTQWTRPYDAQFDDNTYAWTAGMDADLAVRMNYKTGEFTEYLLPHPTNVRHVEVQKTGTLSSFWLGDQHGATITHIEPLAP
jgi:virginiamycin B lyase